MNKTILQHIAIFSNVRYIKTQIRKRQMHNVFMYLWPDLYITLERMKYLTIYDYFFFNLFLFLLLYVKGKEEKRRLSTYSITVFALCIR